MIITNLLTNMIVLTLQGTIPANTSAFQEYAHNTMLTEAHDAAVKWHLNDSVIIGSKISQFNAVPYPSGFSGGISFDNRYAFGFRDGCLAGFTDLLYDPSLLNSDDPAKTGSILKQWLKATNTLSWEQARKIADSAVASINLPWTNRPPRTWQATHIWKDETEFLPYYFFEWRSNQFNTITVGISGITGVIAMLETRFSTPINTETRQNYLELLGLPTNSVVVRQRFIQPGKSPVYELYSPN